MTTITSDRAPTRPPRRPFPFLRLAAAVLLLGLAVIGAGVRYAHVHPPYELVSQTSTTEGLEHREIRVTCTTSTSSTASATCWDGSARCWSAPGSSWRVPAPWPASAG